MNLSLMPYGPVVYPLLAAQVMEDNVPALIRHRGAIACQHEALPLLNAFNFVIDEVLEGGVNGRAIAPCLKC